MPEANAPADPGAGGPTQAQVQQVIARGEAMRNQLAALEGQREMLGDLLGEARRALATLEHVAKAQEGDALLVPLGGGAYIHARLANPATAISSLGSSVHAQLPVAEAIGRLSARVASLESAQTALGKDIARLGDEMARINAFLEHLYGGA